MSHGENRPKVKLGSTLLRRICAFFRPSGRRDLRQQNASIDRPVPLNSDELRPPMLAIPQQYFQQVLNERPRPYSPVAVQRDSPIGGALACNFERPMLTWTQSVRRLNTEYRSTVNALEQVKEYLQGISTKEAIPHSFARPRLVQRMDFNRFPVLAIIEKDETDPLPTESSTTEVRQVESDGEEKPDCTLESISDFKGRVPSLSSNDETTEEETTYTVETFYGKADGEQRVLVVREETTEEQFNAAQEKSSSSSTKPNETISSSIDDSSIVLVTHHVQMDEPLPSSSRIADGYQSVFQPPLIPTPNPSAEKKLAPKKSVPMNVSVGLGET